MTGLHEAGWRWLPGNRGCLQPLTSPAAALQVWGGVLNDCRNLVRKVSSCL